MDEEMLRLLGLGPLVTSAPKPETISSAATPAERPPTPPERPPTPPESPPTVLAETQPLSVQPGQIEALRDSLTSAGFCRYGDVFLHSKSAVTLELTLEPTGAFISVDASQLSEADVCEFLRHEIAADPAMANVGKHLLKAVDDMRIMASAAADPDKDSTAAALDPSDMGGLEQRCVQRLPTRAQLSEHIWSDGSRQIDGRRPLVVFTWGDRLMKKTALRARGSQFNINAKPLSGKGGGADIRKNALQDPRIMLNVAASVSVGHGLQLMANAVRKIEEEDLKCISVFCAKGRHRSVGLAMLLKLVYYPCAKVTHLTIR